MKAYQINIQNLNEYILVITDYTVTIYTMVDSTSSRTNEWASVDRETKNVNWFSGGSKTTIADAKVLAGAIQVAEAVVNVIEADEELTESVIQTQVDALTSE